MIKINLINKKHQTFEFKPNQDGPTKFQIYFEKSGQYNVNDDVFIFHRFINQQKHLVDLTDKNSPFLMEIDYTIGTTNFPSRRLRFELITEDKNDNC